MAFIAIEGVEGCGKSTQASLLAQSLRADGFDVVLTREPGGTPRGQTIREMLLDPAHGRLSPRAEALLYAADRAEHVAEVIRPALDAGSWVICDRFSDSYRAYQGAGRGLDVGPITSWASSGLEPDLVIVLDLPVELGMARMSGSPDRIESAGIDFHTRVRQAFLDLAAAEPERFSIIEATHPVERVGELVREAVQPLVDGSDK